MLMTSPEYRERWRAAPDWAQYYAIDKNGRAFFYETHPTLNADGSWRLPDWTKRLVKYRRLDDFAGDPALTLEIRPAVVSPVQPAPPSPVIAS